MQDIRITTKIGRTLGVFGMFFGACSGFMLRDEYIYPTNEKIKELHQTYLQNSKQIEGERQALIQQLINIEEEELKQKALKKEEARKLRREAMKKKKEKDKS